MRPDLEQDRLFLFVVLDVRVVLKCSRERVDDMRCSTPKSLLSRLELDMLKLVRVRSEQLDCRRVALALLERALRLILC